MQEELSICPSFSSYSSGKLAEVAIKVVKEESTSSETLVLSNNELRLSMSSNHGVDDEVDDNDDDFEFALFCTDLDDTFVPVSDQIRPIFPVFDRDLLLDDDHEVRDGESESRDASVMRIPLKNLFIEDRDIPSSSSSEADELEGIKPATYCFWSPEASPGRCKKSNSTGSSSKTKRWRFRDLLRRSSSDGKDPFVLLTSSPANTANKIEMKPERAEKSHENAIKNRRSTGEIKVVGKSKPNNVAAGQKVVSAHEVFYVRNRAMRDSDRRRSYLPYKQEIVGFLASNGNGLSLTKKIPSIF